MATCTVAALTTLESAVQILEDLKNVFGSANYLEGRHVVKVQCKRSLHGSRGETGHCSPEIRLANALRLGLAKKG